MSKLLQLKEWLTLTEAAKHLSAIFEEEVSESDVLRLALDERIRLSVQLVNGTYAHPGKIVGFEDVEWFEIPANETFGLPGIPEEEQGKKSVKYLKSIQLGEDRYLNLESELVNLRGVWDVVMVGGGRHDVEHLFQMETGGPSVTLQSLDGSFLEKEGVVCQLLESFDDNEFQRGSTAHLKEIKARIHNDGVDAERAQALLNQHKTDREQYLKDRKERLRKDDYYPAGSLPKDCAFVVRTAEILRLQSEVLGKGSLETANPHVDEALSSKERTTLLVLIGLVSHVADFDLDDLSKQIGVAAEQKGIQISRRTIEEKLKAVRAAMSERTR
ncbi:MAG: hypothetical protein QM776_16865 [Rhodocyclaceae bacterium]